MSGQTALHYATEHNFSDMAQLLLDNGAEIEARDILKGANVNAEPAHSSGRTALQGASERGHLVIAELLRRAGAIEEGANSPPEPLITDCADVNLSSYCRCRSSPIGFPAM